MRLSAEHGEGLADLYDAVREALPAETALVEEDDEGPVRRFSEDEDGTELDLTKPLRIAVLARPNAGKSTLINPSAE